jgi:hypothetical protein
MGLFDVFKKKPATSSGQRAQGRKAQSTSQN